MRVLFLFLFVLPIFSNASSLRSDSIRVLATEIALTQINMGTNTIQGNCKYTLMAKLANINHIRFDLQQLTVDSVLWNQNPIQFLRSNNNIDLFLQNTFSLTDTQTIQIYYHGTPAKDPSGWGGFYFTNGIAFNLGVGFQVDPHPFGRAWYPCFDEFTMKSKMKFAITTPLSQVAVANGKLVSVDTLGTTQTWNWIQEQPIPSYLVGIGIGNYILNNYNITLNNRTIPVTLATKPSNASQTILGFSNLQKAVTTFDSLFGEYPFYKVGYCFVPFNGGAMEHAGNIAFPETSISGNISDQLLMAHELAHAWWGDNITCEKDSDMWINEGWASYCEKLFLEHNFSIKDFIAEVKKNHYNVITNAHIADGGFLSIAKVGHNNTYGSHVYKKGASVIHNLRSWLSDSTFYRTMQNMLLDYRFSNVSTLTFAQYVTNATGRNANNFFDPQFLSPGFNSTFIDSFSFNNNIITLFTSQKLWKTSVFQKEAVLKIHLLDTNNILHNYTFFPNGPFDTLSFNISYQPKNIFYNLDQTINDGATYDSLMTNSNGLYFLTNTDANITVNTITDSTLFQVIHVRGEADPFLGNNPGIVLSQNHFWRFISNQKTNTQVNLLLKYSAQADNGRLDVDLLPAFPEDSLLVLFKPTKNSNWLAIANILHNIGSKVDRRGSFTIMNAQPGFYTIAAKNGFINNSSSFYENETLKIIEVSANQYKITNGKIRNIQIYTTDGKWVETIKSDTINLNHLQDGIYILNINSMQGILTKRIKIFH